MIRFWGKEDVREGGAPSAQTDFVAGDTTPNVESNVKYVGLSKDTQETSPSQAGSSIPAGRFG